MKKINLTLIVLFITSILYSQWAPSSPGGGSQQFLNTNAIMTGSLTCGNQSSWLNGLTVGGRATINGTSPGVWLNILGNSKSFIGVDNVNVPNQALGIYNWNLQTFHLNMLDNGNIGVGTILPKSLFDVNGSSYFGIQRNSTDALLSLSPNIMHIVAPTRIANQLDITSSTSLRLIRAGLTGFKHNPTVDFQIGSWKNSGTEASTRLTYRLGHGNTQTPEVDVMTLLSNGNVGIGITSPTAQFHTTGTVRFSGITQDNSLTRIMTQDLNGNIKWRDASTFGTNIYNSNGILTGNRILNANGFNLRFEGTNNTYIGDLTGQAYLNSRLSINNSSPTTINGNVGASIFTYCNNNSSTGLIVNTASDIECGIGIGGDFNASGYTAVGVAGFATQTKTCNSGAPSEYIVGGWFGSNGRNFPSNPFASPLFDAGILAQCNPTIAGSIAGYFDGDVHHTGVVTLISDKRIKKNVKNIENALSILNLISPKQYNFDNSIFNLNLDENRKSFGVIAQDLENILPDLVKERPIINKTNNVKGELKIYSEKIKAVNYTELIPITISAINELNAKVEKHNNVVVENEELKLKLSLLEEKFALLEKSILSICESGCDGLKTTKADVDVLYQSIPNPTDDIAIINYSLVTENADAAIVINTQEGKQIQAYRLEPKLGAGSVKVSLGELSSGTYLYTLTVGGHVVDTKRLQIVK